MHTHIYMAHTLYQFVHIKCLLSGPNSSSITGVATFGTGFKNTWTPQSLSPEPQQFRMYSEASGKHSCPFAPHSLLCSFVQAIFPYHPCTVFCVQLPQPCMSFKACIHIICVQDFVYNFKYQSTLISQTASSFAYRERGVFFNTEHCTLLLNKSCLK